VLQRYPSLGGAMEPTTVWLPVGVAIDSCALRMSCRCCQQSSGFAPRTMRNMQLHLQSGVNGTAFCTAIIEDGMYGWF